MRVLIDSVYISTKGDKDELHEVEVSFMGKYGEICVVGLAERRVESNIYTLGEKLTDDLQSVGISPEAVSSALESGDSSIELNREANKDD